MSTETKPVCPICGSPLILERGCGWCNDCLVCVEQRNLGGGYFKLCPGKVELEQSTYWPDDEENDKKG